MLLPAVPSSKSVEMMFEPLEFAVAGAGLRSAIGATTRAGYRAVCGAVE